MCYLVHQSGLRSQHTENKMKKWILAMAMLALGAATALAGDWKTVVDVVATDKAEARELTVNRTIHAVRIACIEGSVIVNTLWVREGAAKSEIRVARKFNKGDMQEFDLGGEKNVTGFRISDKGPGTYKITAQ